MKHNPGIGATDELSLRVSVATMVKVIFKHSANGEWMLALERKATLHENVVEVKSQPFGGAIRLLDANAIHDLIGDFHFDSERSSIEQDFRLFIRPSSWSLLREFCIQRLSHIDDPVLETDPTRELIEEFGDTLEITLQPRQYALKPMAMIIEDNLTPTENVHARTSPTVRIYRIFEASIMDSSLARAMMTNSETLSHQALCELALKDSQNGGKGRANAILALPLKRLTDHCLAVPYPERNAPIIFEKNRLDETVFAILDGMTAPKYQKM